MTSARPAFLLLAGTVAVCALIGFFGGRYAASRRRKFTPLKPTPGESWR